MKKYLNTCITLFLVVTVLAHTSQTHAMEQETDLHRYTEQGDVNKCENLLIKGSDPNAKNSFDHSCLHIACMNGQLEMVHLLLEHKANPALTNNKKKTPLIYALKSYPDQNIIHLVRALIARNVSVQKNECYRSPLFTAIKYATDTETIKALLDAGANPFEKEIWSNCVLLNYPPRTPLQHLDYLSYELSYQDEKKRLLEKAEENWHKPIQLSLCIKENGISVPPEILKLLAQAIRTCNK